MLKITVIKKIKTVEELEGLNIGAVIIDIGYRGGGIGFKSSEISQAVDVAESDLPGKFGAGCNYLGGGLRGSIFPSGFSSDIKGKKAQILKEIGLACVRAYKDIEKRDPVLNEDTWENQGTETARKSGIRSAY